MIRAQDVRDMTVRELVDLAEEVRNALPGSRKMRRAADRMSAVTWCLEGGALQQMMWWAGSDVASEPPPDAREQLLVVPPSSGSMAKIFEFPQGETSPGAR
jgi:hypothetical protein